MRSVTTAFALALSCALAGSLVACAPSEEDDVEDSQHDVTGGTSAIESPVVYLFDAVQTDTVAPKCAGALLGAKVAVTAKACAKTGLFIGRAAEKDGKGARAKITAVHVPDGAAADIAVVELDREIGGTHAVITHAPLRDGYAVNGIASADGKGFFDPDKGEASSIVGRLTSETEMHSTIFPAKGSEICAGDIGAPVCSSTGTKIAGFNVFGTCGLSGLIIGPEAAAAPAQSSPKAAGENERQRPGQEVPAAEGGGAAECSAGAWKVAQLGRYADFLREYAPEAFAPLVIDKPILRNFPYAPPGLWGYKTGGNVAACKIETAKLDPVAAGTEAKLTAKVTFANLQQRSAPFGRFGIASKSAPTKMRWLPARATTDAKAQSVELTFEGGVTAIADGDYVVAFRASANGGEDWTQCDTDGLENGFSVEKMLSLKVGAGDEPAEETPGNAKPQDATPPPPDSSAGDSSASDYEDPPSTDDDLSDSSEDDSSDSFGEDEPTVGKKRKSSSSGCSASPSGGTAGAGLPMLGILLGVAAFVRRRR